MTEAESGTPTAAAVAAAANHQGATMDVALLETLQHIWTNYIQASCPSNNGESNMEAKVHWLRLFLFYFQYVSDEQLASDDDAFQNFLSLVPEEVCSFLLEHVHGIITASTTSPQPSVPPRTGQCNNQQSIKLLHKEHNFTQLILNAPSDCNKIVALRTFLTHQLGQHLLTFLVRVDFKLIASQKSLCTLCVNLFPNCSWSAAAVDARPPMTLLQPCRDISEHVGNLNLFYQSARPQTKQQFFEPLKSEDTVMTPANEKNGRDAAYAVEVGLTAFEAARLNGDEIAELLVRLLVKCVAAECDSVLTEQSISVTALNFAFEALSMPAEAFVAGEPNETVIKLRLLCLTELCLNNLFAHTADSIVATIQFPYVFAKLLAALRSNKEQPAEMQLCIRYALVYIIFGVMYNLIAIYSSRNPNLLSGGCRSAGLYDEVRLFFEQDEDIVAACVPVLQRQPCAAAELLFGDIFHLLLRIIDQLSAFEQCTPPRALMNRRRLRQQRKGTAVAQQLHCGEAPTLGCRFQRGLLALLPHFRVTLQEQAVRYLAHANTCCCLYTLPTYDACLAVSVDIAPSYQRCAYRFLQCKLLPAIFGRDGGGASLTMTGNATKRRPHYLAAPATVSSCCEHCDTKFKSPEFHASLLQLYCNVYAKRLVVLTSASSRGSSDGDRTQLRIFLQHLKGIAPLLMPDLAGGMLAEIVLPTFRQMAAALGNGAAVKGGGAAQHCCILRECLGIFAAYMCDIRLIKAFYNEENIALLEELLAVPPLIRGVCELIKIGIDNLTFLGDHSVEQAALSRRLITLQLESSRRAAQLFHALLRRFQRCTPDANFWLDNTDFESDASEDEHWMAPLDVLNIAALQWSLNYELLRTSTDFCHEFAKIYAIVPSNDPQTGDENVTNLMGGAIRHAAASKRKRAQKTIADILQLNYNALSSFLLASPPPPLPPPPPPAPHKHQLPTQQQNAHESALAATERCAVSDDKAIDCLRSSPLEAYVPSSGAHGSCGGADNQYAAVSSCATAVTATAASASVMRDCDEQLESYDSIISRYSETVADTFMQQLVGGGETEERVALLFDIRRQGRAQPVPAFGPPNANIAALSTSATAYDAIAQANDAHHQPALAQDVGLIGRLFTIVGSLLYAAATGVGGASSAAQLQQQSTAGAVEGECRLSGDLRNCFYQPSGDSKKLLLKLFEATIAICVKGYQNQQGEAMEKHLRRLKALIHNSAAIDLKQQEEHGVRQPLAASRDNDVLQVLQALLRVAEIAETASVPAGATKPRTDSAPQTPCREPAEGAYGRAGQVRARAGSYMLSPGLALQQELTAATADAGYASGKGATAAATVDSEAEDLWSENEREERLNDGICSVATANDEEGYEADVEVPSASGDSEAEAGVLNAAAAAVAATAAIDPWGALAPVSRYRTHVLHAGLCRLVVEILMELAQICTREPLRWSDSLAQLANRLYVIRDCLGGPLFLLRGFTPLLECNDLRLRELQQSILELITELNTPDVLACYFRILASPNPPVDILVQHLNHSRLTTLKRAQASAELEFPVITDYNCKCVSTADAQLTAEVERLRRQHLRQQATTPLTRAPCLIPLAQSAARLWSDDGLTAALWLHISGAVGGGAPKKKSASVLASDCDDTLRAPSNEDNARAHILSLGTNGAMFSVYIDSALHVVLEMSRPNADSQTCHAAQAAAAESPPPASPNDPQHDGSPVPPSSLRSALKHTKLAILHSLSQMQLFQGNTTNGNGTTAGDDAGGAARPDCQGAAITLAHVRLTRLRWTHLALGLEARANHMDITVYIDGLEQHVASLPFQNLRQPLRAPNSCFQLLALGDSCCAAPAPSQSSSSASCCSTAAVSNEAAAHSHSTLDSCVAPPLRYSVSNLLLFKRRFERRSIVAHLTAMGPDFSELTSCQVGNWPPNYGLMPLNRLESVAQLGHHGEAMQQLKEARLLTYSAQQPLCGRAAGGHTIGLICYGELLPRHMPSLQVATVLSGGLATLLYYFARVVELSAETTTQAMALELLLSVAHADARLYAEFQANDYLNLIGYVIRTERCTKDVQLLRAIVNSACSQPLICQWGGGGGAAASTEPPGQRLYVNEKTTAYVTYPRLLVTVLQRYADWQRSGVQHSDVLDTLLAAVLALTRDKHPHRELNMDQLSRAGFVRHLLNLCKVHLSESHSPIHISLAAARHYVALLAVFAGSPPAPSLMDEIINLLLLLQRASDSYITHNRSNFYFLLSANVPASPTASKEKSRGAAAAASAAAATISHQRRSGGRAARPGSGTRQTHDSGDTVASSDAGRRLQRIERLRRLHAPPQCRLQEFEDMLDRVADCSRLSKRALRLLSPVAVARWRLKFQRHGASCAASAPGKLRHASAACRSYSPKRVGLGHTRRSATALGGSDGDDADRRRPATHAADAPRHVRKRVRLAAAASRGSSATRALYATQKRQRMRAERRRFSDTGGLLWLPADDGGDGQESRRVESPTEDVGSGESQRRAGLEHAASGKRPTPAADFHSAAGVVALQEGLFTLLKDFLYLLPDTAVEEVLRHYVKIEVLMVFSNHPSCGVRAAIIRLLTALTKRLSAAELLAHTKHHYAHHLANQLAIHDADVHMFLACVEWVTGLYGGTLDTVLAHVDALRVQHRFGVPALLAVAAKSAAAPSSERSCTFQVLHSLFLTQTAEEQLAFIDAGLLQCCVKALHTLYGNAATTAMASASANEIAILELLTSVGSKSLKSIGQINIVWDILNMLAFQEEQPQSPLGVRRAFRSAHAQVQLRLLAMFMPAPLSPIGTPPLTAASSWSCKIPADCSLTAAEAQTRFELLVDRCAQFFTARADDADAEAAADEAHMLSASEMRLFELLVCYGIGTNQRCSNFIAWGLSPPRPRALRCFIVDALWRTCRADTLPAILCDGKMVTSLLLLCLYEDLEPRIAHLELLCARLGIHEENGAVMRSLDVELDRIKSHQLQLAERQRQLAERTAYRLEALAAACYQSSMELTRDVTVLQNAERKQVMCHMKNHDEETDSYAKWLDIIRRMTHEGAAWHAKHRTENSWELDDTEGPSRVHTRLRRCRLDIDRRFFMDGYMAAEPRSVETPPTTPPAAAPSKACDVASSGAANIGDWKNKRPLDYLLTSGFDQQCNVGAQNTKVLYNFAAKYLPVDGEIDGEMIVTEQRLCFVATYRCRYFYLSADIANIAEIWLKRYQHQEKAFEIFLDTNRSMLFTLERQADWQQLRDIFADKIVQPPDAGRLQAIMQQWRDGLLTNWEYLMTLNQIAGRTYNDLMQYPVFPWILANYTSAALDLTAAQNFRQLAKPIAVQHEANEQHYIDNYTYISSTMTNMIGSLILRPYHYSSHYSNSGTVLHFLVRVPPFTAYFLRYQDNNFDLPDRTFHALNTTWNLASRDSPTDVKELIPEFFCLPEMFENFEHFNFGCRQSGERVEDVQLPPWCNDDARLFVLIHRQALESEAVRYGLHQWIDLIFGCKQIGEGAIEAINVFHPATYSTMFAESEEIRDPIERKAVETMVRTYGQMPRQLFKAPHAASKPLIYNLGQRPSVLPMVRGLRWGVYVGSPQLPQPVLGNIHKLAGAEQLIGFNGTNVVYALQARECVMRGADVDTFNVVSWGHADRIVRIESLSKRAAAATAAVTQAPSWRSLLHDDSFDGITACGADPNSNQLWFGHMSGRVSVYRCTAVAADASDGPGSAAAKTSRQSYVRGLYLSYNSAFRKITSSKADGGDVLAADQESAVTTGGTIAATLAVNDGHDEATTRAGREGACADLLWRGPIVLVRHTDAITCIAISVEFKLAVTAGCDGLAVIWDLNDWRYVRTIERPAEIHHSPITLLAISPTLGDIVTVHTTSSQPLPMDAPATVPVAPPPADECFEVTEESLDGFVNVSVNPNGKSILRLHSVNARYVQHVVHEDRIDAVCYTHIKEGVGVNCIATAVEGGIVRLWSSWNLAYVAEIVTGKSNIRSIAYSTHQHLIVLTRESHIQVWEADGLYGSAPKFPQIAYK